MLFSSANIITVTFIIGVFFVFISTAGGIITQENMPAEIELKKTLLRNYDHSNVPVKGGPVNVSVDLSLNHVIDIDVKRQMMTGSFAIRLYWTDEFLRWEPDMYDGIDEIHLPPTSVWIPDMVVYDGIKPAVYAGNMQHVMLSANHVGNVQWMSPLVIESGCEYNVQYFPYDTQYCPVKIGSWAYHGWEVDVYNYSHTGDLTNLKSNIEWDILDFPAERLVSLYQCCPQPYPAIEFTIVLRRTAGYYVTFLFIPSAVIIATSLGAFCLPPGSDAKIDLSVTGLLSQMVFLLLVNGLVPPDSNNPPLLGRCLTLLLCLHAFAVIMNVIVKRLHDDSIHMTGPPMACVMRAMHYLKYPLLLYHLNYLPDMNKKERNQVTTKWHPKYTGGEENAKDSVVLKKWKQNGRSEWRPINCILSMKGTNEKKQEKEKRIQGQKTDTLQLLYQIQEIVEAQVAKSKELEKNEAIAIQWRHLAAMLDRILMCMFMIGATTLTIWFLMLDTDDRDQ